MIIIKYKFGIPSWHSAAPPSRGVSNSIRLQSSLKRELQNILHVVIYQRYEEGKNYKRVPSKSSWHLLINKFLSKHCWQEACLPPGSGL